jgi:hypothetical protein
MAAEASTSIEKPPVLLPGIAAEPAKLVVPAAAPPVPGIETPLVLGAFEHATSAPTAHTAAQRW